MPHQHHTVPSYREHKPSGQAVVTLGGRDEYLGKYGSPESRSKYQRLIREYVNNGFRRPGPEEEQGLRVAHLCERYNAFAEREYKHIDGTPTGTVENTRLAMKELFEFAGDVPVEQFGPRLLTQLREKMIARDLARATINDRIGIVRRSFKWAAGQEMLPATLYQALMTVPGLRRGRGGARETERVRPVPQEHIDKSLPEMPEMVQAMVRLQLATGARPGEITILRACDIDRSTLPWIYRPEAHKNSWRGEEREILLGPEAREIVSKWMRPGLQEQPLFSPRESERLRREKLRAARVAPMYPSHVRVLERKRKAQPKRLPGEFYDVDQYRQAITRACEEAEVPHWHPNQLRHNAATRIRELFGLEAAKTILGHRLVETTQIYAESDRKRAREIVERVG
jgi:integrase